MKRLPVVLAALLAFAAEAVDVGLTRLAPADYSAVILIDIRRMLGNRDVQRVMASRGAATRFSEVESVGLRIARIRELAVFLWDSHWYGVMRFEGAAELERELARRSADGKSKIAAEVVAGTRIYRLKRPPKPDGRHKTKELCLVFPGGETVVLAKAAEVANFLTCRRLDPAAAAQLADTDAEMWCEYRGKPAEKKPDEELDNVFDMRLKKGVLAIRLTGADRRRVDITGVGEFSDPAAARSMGTTLPGILAFLTGIVFAEDPEGGDELVRALRSEVKGGELLLSLSASEEMFRRFLRAEEAFLSEKKHGRGGARSPRRNNRKHGIDPRR